MLRPVTQVAVKKEKERLKAIDNEAKNPTTSVKFEKERSPPSGDEAITTQSYVSNNNRESSTVSMSSSSDDDEDDQDESITMMMYLKSIVFMPKSLRILCFTNLLSWMGHILYCLYFTDFVGESVFGGDPAAAVDSPEYDVSN